MKQTYLVGGAVRDKQLGYPFHERDWVVVGATPETMQAEGFRQVGKDFPVFLHPTSGEEYALARTERKTAPGYGGFVFHTDPSITLEDDLIRRDLTINAMAETPEGTLVDPYGGQDDLRNKILRHVSSAFSEDPVRILRVARFAARYHHLGFHVAEETLSLMTDIVASGEASHLVAERVWKEMERALGEQSPDVFIRTLRDCNALAVIMPEIDDLFGVPQPPQHHPEIDTGEHALLSLCAARSMTTDSSCLFAALVHDLGKAATPSADWPKHHGHEALSLPLIEQFCRRLAVPKQHRELALAVARDHTNCHRAFELKASTVLQLLQRLDAFRRPEKLDQFLLCCQADARGRTGFEETDYPQAAYLKSAYLKCMDIQAKDVTAEGVKGKAIGERLAQKRIAAIKQLKQATI
ncbi:MAG: multifunctional CCA addition/repair protein [Cellvibrionaceae bacterium]|nr:multifunctional CCA addition/repair protein [Cellvibrionaceae bacterium]